MSPKGQQLGRFLQLWLGRASPKRFGLPLFFLISLLIHAGFLWHFRFISRHAPRPYFLSKIATVPTEARGSIAAKTTETEAFPGTSASALRRDRQLASPDLDASASSESESFSGSNTPTGDDSSAGSGTVATDSGGGGFAGPGSSTGSVGTKESGSSTGTGGGTAKGKSQPAPAKGTPSAAERSVIVIPPAIQHTTSPYESEVYAEVDFYTLFTADLRASVNVPGNEVCLDGDILRTHERRVFTHRVTDISKCRYENQGDDQERMRCPPEAHTVIIAYDNYLSSPINYTVNICFDYDRSSCYTNMRDDGPELEICRVRGKYEGIWAAGTIFRYPCAKSSSQTFSHPLEYEVRFLQNVEFPDARMRRRLVHREKRPVALCQ